MEGIFEVLLQILVEVVFGIVEEIVGGLIEHVVSGDFWNFPNRRLSESTSFSNEIITLDIFNHNKEIFKK
jgi:hypothetical protein